MRGIHWETTDPFRVEWLSTTEVEFYWIGHLNNSLNENRAVLVGKDGQEIEDQCGRSLLHEMEMIAQKEHDTEPPHRSPRTTAYRGRGTGYRGRGRGSGRGARGYNHHHQHHIKQEDE